MPEDFDKSMPAPWDGQRYPSGAHSGAALEILEAIESRRQRITPPPDILVYRKTAPTWSAAANDDAEQERLLSERKAVNAFFEDFFVNEADGFRAAFNSAGDLDAFEAQYEADLEARLQGNRSIGRAL